MPRSLLSLWEMIKGRWREFVREPSAFFFVLFMPLLWMAILGFAFSGNRQDVFAVGWLSGGSPSQTGSLEAALKADPRIRLTYAGEPALRLDLIRGDILLYVQAAQNGNPQAYVYDPASREAVRARTVVDSILQTAAGRRDALATTEVKLSVPGTRYIDFLVPGLAALSIMTSSLFGIGAVIVVNRRENLLKRYLVTPMQPFNYIVSHIFGRFFILAVELTAILVGGWAMFHFHINGDLFSFIIFAALGAAVFTALAMLCGSRTSNMAVMNGMTNLITVPLMIVSGVWFARGNFPDWIATPSRYLPLTALVDGLRKIALEGANLSMLGHEIVVLSAYLVLTMVATKMLFKWY